MALSLLAGLSPAVAAAPDVAVSIVPIHSLVAGVMDGIGSPRLLVPVGASPHNYALKPSDARALQSADLIVWVGETLETFLQKPIRSLGKRAEILEVADIDGLTLLDSRKGGNFEAHNNEPKGHKHGHTDGHDHDKVDPHIWLDTRNVRSIVAEVTRRLGRLDPVNANAYGANAAKMLARLDALDEGIQLRLAPVRQRPYIVFHDAYQYFERQFGTRIVGAVTVSPDQAPGAKRLAELRDKLRATGATCVFREPQFPAPIVETIVQGTGAKIGILDPEGANLAPGPDAYFVLMGRITDSLASCLAMGS